MLDTSRKVLVAIVDSDRQGSSALSAVLSAHGFDPSCYESGEALLSASELNLVALVLLEFCLPGMDGLDVQRALAERGVEAVVMFLSAPVDIRVVVQAVRAGALDFLEKPISDARLLDAIRAALAPQARSVGHVQNAEVTERLMRLTSREREVLDLLLLGMTNKLIAERLSISQRTVEVHRARIRDKMEARGLSDLIRLMR